RSTFAFRSSTVRASSSSSGRRRRGRCRRTSQPRSTLTRSTAGVRTASGWRSRAIPRRTSRSGSAAPSSSAGATAGRSTSSRAATVEAAEQIIGDLEEKGVLVEAGLHEHRYPECWRCHTPLIFRLADDWFISVRDLRGQMLDANATVEWIPEYMGKRMDDWLHN